MLRNLREIMGLTIEQVADELSISPDQVALAEKTNDKEYSRMFFYAFPINRKILRYPDADPFLPSYDQTSPGKRLESWMLENKISASTVARALNIHVEDVFKFIKHSRIITKAEGEEIQRKLGINRKWLMYGDGRNKGKPIQTITIDADQVETSKKSLLELMSADFKKLPDDRIVSKGDIVKERKEWGHKVREARKNADLTLKGLAEYLGLSSSRIGQMECGIITEKQAKEVLIAITNYSHNSQILYNQKISDEDNLLLEDDLQDRHFLPLEKADDSKAWGQIIRKKRKGANLTIKGLAKLLGLSSGRICQMECGMISKKQAENVIVYLSEYTKCDELAANPPHCSQTDTNIRTLSQDGVDWGAKIKAARNNAGFSQQHLGNIIGKSHATVSLIEKGHVTEETAKWILTLIENTQRNKRVQYKANIADI